jgi:hypothetical protein
MRLSENGTVRIVIAKFIVAALVEPFKSAATRIKPLECVGVCFILP